TTMADAGYYIMVRAEGDQTNSSGVYQVLIDSVVVAVNPCFVRNESATGFTVNLYYKVAELNPDLFEIFDQDENEVDILSIVKGDNDATYIITIDDASITNFYTIAYSTESWAMQFYTLMSDGETYYYSEMWFVELEPIEE
ncbi:MAG: hypothetical protein GX904_00510, partial [Acholeplasmataceae bacterium]|nr:hypothetical protein [Acholeplasmataceae bacterium]